MSSYPQSTDVVGDRSNVSQSAGARVVLESLEASALDIDEYAQILIRHSQSATEVNRRAGASRRRQLLEDNWRDICKAALQNWIHPAVYSLVVGKNGDQADISRNPAKDIWCELATLYKRAAARTTRKNAVNGDRYQKLVEGTFFDLFWQKVELYVEAFNDVIVWPVVTEIDGVKTLQHRIATPDMVTIKTASDDPHRLEAVLIVDTYLSDELANRTRYYLWTKDWYAVYDEAGERIDVGENVGENVYGSLAFMVPIHYDPFATDFWSATPGEDLVWLSILTGRNRTYDALTRKMSGFTQLMQWGDDPEPPKEQLRSEGAMLSFVVGANGGVREVEWKANLTERADLTERDAASGYASRGINPERMKTGHSYQAAAAGQNAERGLSERRELRIETWTDAEQRYYRAVCLVAAKRLLRPASELPDGDDVLDAQHAPPELSGQPAELAKLMETRVGLGLESPVTLCRREHPGWSVDQCKAFVKQNADDTAWFQGIRSAHQVPKQLSNSSLADEENGAHGPMVRDGIEQPPAGPPAGEPAQGMV